MAKHNPLHPGVQVYLKGSTFCVRFKQNGYDCRKGLGTSDSKIAEDHAVLMFKILHGEAYDYKDVPEAVRKALGLLPPDVREIMEEALPPGLPLEDDPEETEGERRALSHGIDLFEKLQDERKNNKTLSEENHALRKKVTALEAMLEAGGLAKLKNVKPKKLKDAITDYVANGTGASIRTKKEYTNYLNQFKKKIDGDRELSKIDPVEIISYLQDLDIDYIPTIQKITSILCAMLDNQTGGTYPTHPIKEWKRKNLKTDGKTDDDFYWIEEKDVKTLAEQVKKDSGEYRRCDGNIKLNGFFHRGDLPRRREQRGRGERNRMRRKNGVSVDGTMCK